MEYSGGATTLWVPDQLKSAITRPCRYEPGVNRTCKDLAAHYGAVVVPARPRKPRDKAALENCVLIAQRWILARLMGGAPYGYRYLRKRDDSPASYAVVEAEARVVRDIYADSGANRSPIPAETDH